ncbi:NAD(P)H-quinone oxidoreductase [Hyphococcus lacteus]|uniref:NAD(P)H-quinone oxidoreductase n=1 Tax=Hyphococcus lacteus TaxID=3143536 RepID=A0ABV3Z6E1_9PROT
MTDISKSMRAIEISTPGGPEVLKITERPTPIIRENEVLLAIKAAGVNRPDVLQRMGMYPPPPGATDIPGLEAAGVVAAIGKNVSDINVGDKICALLPGGGYADFATVDAGSCLPVPTGFTFEQAAALPETVFTVWANMIDDGDLKAGETLLVHGGTSGIGAMAIAMAKAFGAKVIATAGSDEKCQAALNLGADATYNYRDAPWDKEIADNGGADVVLDMTGGDFVARNISCLNHGGRHVSIAFLRGAEAKINILPIMQKRLRLSGSTMKARALSEKARLARDIEKQVWPHLESGKMAVTIDKIFPLEQASEAHKHMESGAHVGKIILKTR